MAVTQNEYTQGSSDGATRNVTFEYQLQSDVKVTLDGTATTAYTWPSDTSITFNSTPTTGAKIRIYRDTNIETPKHTFAAGSSIKANDLNKTYEQLRFRLDEEIMTEDVADEQITSDKIKTLDSTKLTGTIPDARFPATLPTASGANLTSIPTSSLTGTVTPSDNTVTSAKIVDGTIVNADINASAAIDVSKLGTGELPTGAKIDNRYYTETELDAGQLDNRYYTETELNAGQLDSRYYTETEADARFYNLASAEEIQSGETWVAADNKVATTAAIDARITDMVDDVGGFVPINNETSFPSTNPDVNNGTGTLISVKALASSHTPSDGTVTITDGAGSGNDVTITGCGSTNLDSGYGLIVETTTTLHTYTFHRLTPKATEVTTVASNIGNINTVATNNANITTVAGVNANVTTVAGAVTNVNTVATNVASVNTCANNISDVNNFGDLYQINASEPDKDGGNNDLAAGDLWFDSSSNKTLKVHNGTSFQAVSPAQSVLDDISIVSGSLSRQEDMGSITDAISTGSATGSLDTCANNITNINTFANVYRIAATAPDSSLDEGDLWYDETNNKLKYYNGSAWAVTAAAGLSSLSDDTSPQLGGNLDCNNKNLTAVGTVSGNNLQIDFGTIA